MSQHPIQWEELIIIHVSCYGNWKKTLEWRGRTSPRQYSNRLYFSSTTTCSRRFCVNYGWLNVRKNVLNIMLREIFWWTSIPYRGSSNTYSRFTLWKSETTAGLLGHLVHKKGSTLIWGVVKGGWTAGDVILVLIRILAAMYLRSK